MIHYFIWEMNPPLPSMSPIHPNTQPPPIPYYAIFISDRSQPPPPLLARPLSNFLLVTAPKTPSLASPPSFVWFDKDCLIFSQIRLHFGKTIFKRETKKKKKNQIFIAIKKKLKPESPRAGAPPPYPPLIGPPPPRQNFNNFLTC